MQEVLVKKLQFDCMLFSQENFQFCLLEANLPETFVLFKESTITKREVNKALKNELPPFGGEKNLIKGEHLLSSAMLLVHRSYVDYLDDLSYQMHSSKNLKISKQKRKKAADFFWDMYKRYTEIERLSYGVFNQTKSIRGYEVYLVNKEKKVWISKEDWELLGAI